MAKNQKALPSNVEFDDQWTVEQEELTQMLLKSKFSRYLSRHIGRPTVLTPDLVERFLQAARQGLPLEVCCDYCLIDRVLFYSWRDWYQRIKKRIDPILARAYKAHEEGESYKFSKQEQHSLRLNADEATLVDFFNKLIMLRAEYGLRIMTGLNVAAMGGNVSAAQWLLKGVFPEHFSDVNQGAGDSESGGVGYAYIEVNAEPIPDEIGEKNITPRSSSHSQPTEIIENVQ